MAIQRKVKTFYKIKNKHLRMLRGTIPGIIISGWIFQGFLYMNIYEKIYKVLLEISILLICYSLCSSFLTRGEGILLPLIWSLLIGHTITWFLNGQAMTMFIHMNLIPNSPGRFISYTDKLVNNVRKKNYIMGAAAFGGLTRCEYRSSSDLDVRLVMKEGILNGIRASHFCFVERVKALLNAFPLDLFAFDLEETHKKMNLSENPIILYDNSDHLKSLYRHSIYYEKFRKEFSKKYIRRF